MISIFGIVVAGIMFIKLSYLDLPYLIGGILFLYLGIFVAVRNKN